uniref:Uncharacterized protein n=1 Tax=Grammatophora oceanica TaxID=210454 RepID=A0A7S1VDR1_9STRA|eukprot:CAMPEP_0194053954 /NCGR_PEP_ID=MMETSP0009_2-20130614/51942_1 /TAXON_ID=210454 /ORGANISM="Grammatophora oceanica, Strain CCMP 410" /LENGTH=157 /DNA_ID=CAMNT_0038702281 /DNA_START=174 /DNA_END=647 /DNA_ORIENTATION=+
MVKAKSVRLDCAALICSRSDVYAAEERSTEPDVSWATLTVSSPPLATCPAVVSDRTLFVDDVSFVAEKIMGLTSLPSGAIPVFAIGVVSSPNTSVKLGVAHPRVEESNLKVRDSDGSQHLIALLAILSLSSFCCPTVDPRSLVCPVLTQPAQHLVSR